MKRTPWFAGTVKPARPGVYERRFGFGEAIRYATWTGSQWCLSAGSILRARERVGVSGLQDAPEWRGLAERPA